MAERTLQIDDDIEYQRRSWRIQRIVWVVWLLILVAAVLGLVGPGPLSSAEAGAPGSPLRVRYNRFERYNAPASLEVDAAAPGGAGQLRVWLSRDFLDAVELESVLPEPESVEARPDRVTYVFAAPEAGTVRVVFRYRADGYGSLPGTVGLEDGPALDVSSFIFP